MSLPRVRFLAILAFFASACLIVAQTADDKLEAQKLYKEATALDAKKDYAGAAGAMVKALELTPKNDAYLAFASKVEFQAGKTKEALAHGLEATTLKPGNANYLAIVMRGTLAAKDHDTAKSFADKIIALGGAKAGAPLVAEARGVVAKVEFPNTDPILVAARYASPEKIKTLTNSVRASAKAEPKNPLHKDRLLVLEPLARIAELDLQALATPKSAEGSLEDLAAYLGKLAKTDTERARVLYRWITDRIEYDAELALKDGNGELEPAAVLKKRRCLCGGFAKLFEDLGTRMGLEVAFIVGDVKLSQTMSDGHGWNAVKIDNQWRLVDATIGGGYVENGKSFKKFNAFYFFTAPEKLICSHFPKDEKWQLLETPVTREQFDKAILADFRILRVQPDLAKVREATQQKGFRSFVLSYVPTVPFKMIDGPLSRHLTSGKSYQFEFEAPEECASIVFDIDGQYTPLSRKGFRFEGRMTPRRGSLEIRGSLQSSPKQFHSLLKYEVE